MSLKKASLLVLFSSVLVIISYFYFDRQIVDFFHSVNTRQFRFLHYLQQIPEPLFYMAPIGIIYFFIQYFRKKADKFAYFSLAAGSAVLIVSGLKRLFKFCAGRYWPDTFTKNNLSYVHDGVYGFDPFHWEVQYQSFPSGHMMTIVAFTFVLASFYPKLKWLSVTLALIVAICLLALYYHFLSDVIAGSVLGLLIASVILKRTLKNN